MGDPSHQNFPSAPENRLGRETSPYLRQHRFNPVDWYPWGREAFEEARRRDVPIFLSIGYSTCYWCHVMERESFENGDIAARLNESFVCVKVDREERPDVDDVYMAAVQAFTGHGGWPMSLFLEPEELRPFFAGTYFPAVERSGYAIPSFPQITQTLAAAWRERRDEVLAQARELANAAAEQVSQSQSPVRVGPAQVTQAVTHLLRMHDPRLGGFGQAPKFPQPVFLELLLDTRAAAADEATRAGIDQALRSTLDAMACGGLFDQVGGGFHRYCVDARWIVPHFEKMLYDNAQLLRVYARAAGLYASDLYRRTATRTLDYLLRELADRREGGLPADAPVRGFFAAQDAEVNHREGLNYLWTREDVHAALDAEDAAFAERVYGLAAGPNFRDPHHPDEAARNVLHLGAAPEVLARQERISERDLWARLDRINAQLLVVRSRRAQPGTDRKVITAWNGLAIAALADSAALLHRPDALVAAEAAADFLLETARTPSGLLARCWTDGAASIPAVLEDYAALALGLAAIARSKTEGDRRATRIAQAQELVAIALERFTDRGAPGPGVLVDAPREQSGLFASPRSWHDGAVPSASSLMLHAAIDLWELTHEPDLLRRALEVLRAMSGVVARSPLGAANSTRSVLRLLRTDEQLLGLAFAGLEGPPESGTQDAAPADSHAFVEVLTTLDQIIVGPDSPAVVPIRVRVRPGYHVNAAVPAADPNSILARSLTGLRVGIINGTGVQAYCDYPAGEPLGGADGPLTHSGDVDLEVVVERAGDWSGRPLLALTFQACSETECYAPATVELDIAIDRE
jgi:uncharacterized protein YyaL (SSP411 family)